MDGARFGGQIGGAAIIHIAIIPCIAIFIYNLSNKNYILLSLILLIVTLLSLIFTQSRMAILTVILFFGIYLIQKLTKKTILWAMIIGVILILVIFDLSSSSRFATLGLTDSSRSINTETSLKLATDSLETFVFGNGYGSVWSWSSFQQGYHP